MKISLFPFSQHEGRFDGSEFAAQIIPEVDGNIALHFTAITVNAELCNPILHSLGHLLANTGLGVI